jgi:transcriptional regulator with XRE-family HTH domain
VPPSTPAQLGVAIRRLRNSREMSIEALAEKANIHWTYLSAIEHGRGNPTWIVVGSLAEALGVEMSELADLAAEAQNPQA